MRDTSRTNDWRSLCELASQEKNPQKLLELLTKINRALEVCRQRSRTEASCEVDTFRAPITGSQYDFESQRRRTTGEPAGAAAASLSLFT